MTPTSARFFDELAKVMTNAAGAAQGLRGEMDTLFRTQAERVLNDLEVVQREEFDVVRDVLQFQVQSGAGRAGDHRHGGGLPFGGGPPRPRGAKVTALPSRSEE